MKAIIARLAAAVLLFGFATGLVSYGLNGWIADDFHAFRLAGAATCAAILGVFLALGARFARWIALGWALNVLANVAGFHLVTGYALVGDEPSFRGTMSFGAIAVLVLLGHPAVRRGFEPNWTTPLHHLYRWTAISVSACITHATLSGMFGLAAGSWSAAFAAGLMLFALALLSAARVVALPVSLLALLVYVTTVPAPMPRLETLTLAVSGIFYTSELNGSASWQFFVGPAARWLWIPALAVTAAANILAAKIFLQRAKN
jgi:hypothetical protein